MESSPTQVLNNSLASQYFLNILWKPKVRYGVHNSLPLFPIMYRASVQVPSQLISIQNDSANSGMPTKNERGRTNQCYLQDIIILKIRPLR
jgi:hypothetical protein